jgi:hypothetical protein
MNKKIFGIIFPLFFIIAVARGLHQTNWVSYLAPVFYLYFIWSGYTELKNKELKVVLLIVASFGFWAMVTALWSPDPRGSFLRGIIFIVISWSFTFNSFGIFFNN